MILTQPRRALFWYTEPCYCVNSPTVVQQGPAAGLGHYVESSFGLYGP